MPIPIFYLEFRKEHGRNPRPQEMTVDQRRSLRRCCMENLERDMKVVEAREELNKLVAEPEYWHKLLAELPEGEYRREVMRSFMEDRDAFVARARKALESQSADPDHWQALIRESVGLAPL